MSSRTTSMRFTPDEKTRIDQYEQGLVNPDEKKVFRHLVSQRQGLINSAHLVATQEATLEGQSKNNEFVRNRAAKILQGYLIRLLESEIFRLSKGNPPVSMKTFQPRGVVNTVNNRGNSTSLELAERNLQKVKTSSLKPYLAAVDVFYPPDTSHDISPAQHSAAELTAQQEQKQVQVDHTPEYEKGYADALSYIKYFILNDVNGLQSSLGIVWDPTKGWFKDTVTPNLRSPSRRKKFNY